MSIQRDHVLREMGLGPIWKLRAVEAVQTIDPISSDRAQTSIETSANSPSIHAPLDVSLTSMPPVEGMRWEALDQTVQACRACGLCQGRKQAVFGVGDVQADWLFVGDGPGAEEDDQGEPFVGQAGKLLDSMLAAIDLQRGKNVYLTNAIKCRPSNNSPPEAQELVACRPYLQRQIELIQPKLIVVLGRVAAESLLQREIKLGAERGQLLDYKGIPLVVTYHPTYLLRNLQEKAQAWEDLCFARRAISA